MKNGCCSHRQGLGKQFIGAVVMAVLLLSCHPYPYKTIKLDKNTKAQFR